MNIPERKLQSFRRGPSGRVLQVEVRFHPESKQHIVLWDDILEVFPGTTSVLNGDLAVTRARDASLRVIEPRCIIYQFGKVLEVILAGDLTPHHSISSASSTDTAVGPQSLTRKNIEQWAQATAENTAMKIHSAPSIFSEVTDTTDHHFKPLYVPTETDAESVRDEMEQDDPPTRSPLRFISVRDSEVETSRYHIYPEDIPKAPQPSQQNLQKPRLQRQEHQQLQYLNNNSPQSETQSVPSQGISSFDVSSQAPSPSTANTLLGNYQSTSYRPATTYVPWTRDQRNRLTESNIFSSFSSPPVQIPQDQLDRLIKQQMQQQQQQQYLDHQQQLQQQQQYLDHQQQLREQREH